MKRRATATELLAHSDARLVWVQADTRWHVYPQRQPVQLAIQDWYGTWLPCRDGTWYLAPVSYVTCSDAHSPALLGAWVETPIGVKSAGRDLTVTDYHRAVA